MTKYTFGHLFDSNYPLKTDINQMGSACLPRYFVLGDSVPLLYNSVSKKKRKIVVTQKTKHCCGEEFMGCSLVHEHLLLQCFFAAEA